MIVRTSAAASIAIIVGASYVRPSISIRVGSSIMCATRRSPRRAAPTSATSSRRSSVSTWSASPVTSSLRSIAASMISIEIGGLRRRNGPDVLLEPSHLAPLARPRHLGPAKPTARRRLAAAQG